MLRNWYHHHSEGDSKLTYSTVEVFASSSTCNFTPLFEPWKTVATLFQGRAGGHGGWYFWAEPASTFNVGQNLVKTLKRSQKTRPKHLHHHPNCCPGRKLFGVYQQSDVSQITEKQKQQTERACCSKQPSIDCTCYNNRVVVTEPHVVTSSCTGHLDLPRTILTSYALLFKPWLAKNPSLLFLFLLLLWRLFQLPLWLVLVLLLLQFIDLSISPRSLPCGGRRN